MVFSGPSPPHQPSRPEAGGEAEEDAQEEEGEEDQDHGGGEKVRN